MRRMEGNAGRKGIWSVMFILSLGGLLGLVRGCGEPALPEGCKPITELKEQGLCPVTVESVSAMLSPVQRMFRARVKNVADVPVVGFSGTVVLTRQAGSAPVQQEIGHMDPIQPILPGETAELTFIAQDPEADRARLVIRQVMYKAEVSGGYTLTFKLENPQYAAELAAPALP